MRIFRDALLYVILAVGVVFVVAMVSNFIGAAKVIKSLYREDNTAFWVVVGGYIAISVAVIAVRLRQRISRRPRRRD